MATVVTEDDQGDSEVISAEASAHEAAVAEGATAVQAEQAAAAAEEAKAAAEVALSAAQNNIESGVAVEQAAQRAESGANVATVSAEMVHEALLAQTNAIKELTAELQASRKQAAQPTEKPRRQSPDTEPGGNGRRWVRR